jgi:hypothetical protein
MIVALRARAGRTLLVLDDGSEVALAEPQLEP